MLWDASKSENYQCRSDSLLQQKRFPVCTFHTDNQYVFTIPFYGSAIHGCVKTDTLHTIWIGSRIKIIAPLQRYMFPRNYRIRITTNNTIRFFHGRFDHCNNASCCCCNKAIFCSKSTFICLYLSCINDYFISSFTIAANFSINRVQT